MWRYAAVLGGCLEICEGERTAQGDFRWAKVAAPARRAPFASIEPKQAPCAQSTLFGYSIIHLSPKQWACEYQRHRWRVGQLEHKSQANSRHSAYLDLLRFTLPVREADGRHKSSVSGPKPGAHSAALDCLIF